jgi:TonB-dependent receptor
MGRGFDGGAGIGGLFAGPDAIRIVLSGAFHDDSRGIDDVEESYTDQQSSGVPDKVLSNLQYRRYLYNRKRYGLAANIEAKATESTALYVRLLWSGYLETAHKHYLVADGLDSDTGCTPLPACIQDPSNPRGYIASSATLEQSTTDSLERIANDLAVIGGSSTFQAFRLDYKGSVALGSDRVSSSYGSTWVSPNVPVVYDSNTDPRYPRFHTLNGVNPADPANYSLQEIDLGPSYDQDREYAGTVDASIPAGRFDGLAKLGASVRFRNKTHSGTSPVFTPTGTINLAPYTYGAPQIYYNDLYNIGPAISLPGVRGLVSSALGSVTDDIPADQSANTDDDENVYAGYGEYEAHFGKFGLLAGVRVEATHATYRGNLYDGDTDTNTPTTKTASYTDVFPTVQGRYDFLNNLTGRLTYSTGIARPGFNQITPGASISVTNAAVTVGNPDLKPTYAQNFDAALEFYPGDGQIAAVGLFDKEFSNYILLSQQIVQGYNFPGLTGVITTVQSYSNGPAHARGIEAQYQEQLRFLPHPLDGFGYSANVTYVDSEAEIHPGITGLLPSTSRLTWNAAVFYERDPLTVRLAADFVGQNLFSFGGIVGNQFDVYSRQRLTLDFGSSYALSPQVRFYLNAKNLLNTPLEFTEGPSSFRPIQREFYDITVLAGVRVDLH